jgi:hypothetical protein
MADPARFDSFDKLAAAALAERLYGAPDPNAVLEELGWLEATRSTGIKTLRFPGNEEYEEASKSGGVEEINKLLVKCGLKGVLKDNRVTVETVQDKADHWTKSIFKNFRFLGDVLDRHEAIINRRWLKKSNKTRRKLILEAWGTNMASSHRPDFEAIELERPIKRMLDSDYRDSYLLPYINEEDLCKPHSLLLLMSTRGRCHPSTLAAIEHEAHGVGGRLMNFLLFEMTSPGDYRIDLVSEGGEDCYGKLWSQESNPDKYEFLGQRRYTDFNNGLLILEAQARVLSFLVNCVKLMLHDFTETSMLLSPLAEFVPTLSTKTDAGYASQEAFAAEAPYRQPASLDFDRIISLLAAKHDNLADHLWSLREDPSYFEAHMLDYKEHRRELLLDPYGRKHPACISGQEDKFWGRVVGDQIYFSHFKLEVYADLVSQAEQLKDMQTFYADVLKPSCSLPERYAELILVHRFFLEDLAQTLIREVAQYWYASPLLRMYFVHKPEKSPTALVTEIADRPEINDDSTRARIYWLLCRLWTSGDQLCKTLGMTNLVDELQRLVSSESAKRCISPYIDSIVSELALVCECLRQIEMYRPWSQMSGDMTDASFVGAAAVFQLRLQYVLEIYCDNDRNDDALGSLGNPTGGKFVYPVGKRRTRENVEAMRSAEENLDKLWRQFDQDVTAKAYQVLEAYGLKDPEDSPVATILARRALMSDRTLERTPAWTESEPGINQTPVTELYVPFSQLCFDDAKSDEQTLRKSLSNAAKTKTKTHKPGSPTKTTPEVEAATPIDGSQAGEKLALNARALKVFKTLFFTPSATSTPGEVAWTDFLYAMVSVGLIPEKLYGSVWQFSPDPAKLAIKRNIQFQEPHGANTKISYWIARRHGRRLNRAYGWDGSSFTLEEKTKQ